MSDTRQLDHGTPPERFARGWHCLGLAESFRDGRPHGIEAFGGKVVVWQDSQGEINVLDGYCRHMGGDLTQGEVKGDEVACFVSPCLHKTPQCVAGQCVVSGGF